MSQVARSSVGTRYFSTLVSVPYSCKLGHLDLLELSKTGTLSVLMTCSTRLAHVVYLSETYVSDVLVSWFTRELKERQCLSSVSNLPYTDVYGNFVPDYLNLS